MSKKSIRRSSRAMDTSSHQTLRRSPRFLSSEMIGKVSSLQPIGGKDSVETHLGNLSTMSVKLDVNCSSLRVGTHQTTLRRSPRFLPPEKLKPDISSQKSTLCRKSVEIDRRTPSITSKSKEAESSRKIVAAICRKSQLKMSKSKSGVVLEATRSGPWRSLRLASQTGMKVSEISQGFPDKKPRRQSMRVHGVTPASAENVKERIENPNANDEVIHKKPLEVDCKLVAAKRSMELVSAITRAGKECNEPGAITISNPVIVSKKECKPMSSPIRRSSHRLMESLNGVINRGVTFEMTDKGEEVAEKLNVDKGDLVFESRIKYDFVITKTADLHKAKRIKLEKDNGVENRIEKIENEECRGTVAWTNEQEEALQKAYLMAKPSPHFWKKVSRMVPGKSAQECFNKIHASISTPLSLQPRSRTTKKSLSPIPNLNLSSNILPEIEPGRLRRCRTKKLAAQKTVRHLLRKHRLADQTQAPDHFSLLESSPINFPVNILNDISNSPLLSQQPGEKLSANSNKMFSRFKLLASPDGPSPQVLKKIKNRALHDRYIDQLHQREARRVVIAKKSKVDDLGGGKCFSKFEHGALRAARTALISDAKSFINHFQHNLDNPIDELDADSSDDDIDGSDLDE